MRGHRSLLVPVLALGLANCTPVPQPVATSSALPPRTVRVPRASAPRVLVVPAPVVVPPPAVVVVVPTPPPDRPNGQPGWWPCMLGDKLC